MQMEEGKESERRQKSERERERDVEDFSQRSPAELSECEGGENKNVKVGATREGNTAHSLSPDTPFT